MRTHALVLLLVLLAVMPATLMCAPEVQVRRDDLDGYLSEPDVTPRPTATHANSDVAEPATSTPCPIRESVIDDSAPAPSTTPASTERFEELRERIRRLAQEAVALSKQNKTEQAQAKIDQARMLILSFDGSAEQRQRLTEEYDMLLTLLDELIEPERSTPADAVRFILTPPEPSTQDLASVEAARSIPSLRHYLAGLDSSARRRVAAQLAVFNRTERGRKLFQLYLDRSSRYRQHIQRVLAKYNLPAELFCVALIESGFSETAVSHAGAAGMWQFMPDTGRDYGMSVDRWLDERLDWIQATDAAARYLKNSLAHYQGDIELAVASYNTGTGNVDRAIRHAGTRNYWHLKLHPETMGYVPKWIAAMILYYDAERFGFRRPNDSPIDYDSITIRGSVGLDAIAGSIGQNPNQLMALNRSLIRHATPPDRPYVLRLPPGTRDRLLANLDDLLESQSVIWIAHRIREGESPAAIAKHYDVPVQRIIDANDLLERNLPEPGEVIMVPVNPDNQLALAQLQRAEDEQRREAATRSSTSPATNSADPDDRRTTLAPAATPKPKKVAHKVRPRESLWTIAERYDVTVADLKAWNKTLLDNGNQIQVGQRLTVYVGSEPVPVAKKYTVRRGDSLSGIANRHGVTVRDLAAANGITSESTIYPGMELAIPGSGGTIAEPAPSRRTHIVRRGETLSEIADRYDLSIQNLMAWNRLSNADALRPGQTLLLMADASSGGNTIYTVKRGDTLAKIAKKFGVTTNALASANSLSTRAALRAGQKLKIPSRTNAGRENVAWTKYKVRSGDTLASIAKRQGCTIDDLAAWNNLKRSAKLQVGQILKIQTKKKP